MQIPEFYVIHGYDESGYYFNGPLCDDRQGPKPWKELGDTGIGWMEISVVTSAKAADIKTATRDAFIFALDHARHPEKWTFPGYATGLAAFQSWISCLEENRTSGGVAFNAAVWAECRHFAVSFLKDVQTKLDKRLTDFFY